ERRFRGAWQLYQAKHALLRRAREPHGTGEGRLQLPAAAAGRLRIAEVHAADPPRDGECQRSAGIVRLHADAQGPRRGNELPDGEAYRRTGSTASRERSVLRLLLLD